MFGKHFASMYTGSMVGAGAVVFAVWGYVIANARPDKKLGGYVELNASLLAAIIGEDEKDIQKAIDFLCKPDPKTRTPDKQGRRLVQLGPYAFQVVNYAIFRAIRNEEDRREQNRINQQKKRERDMARNGSPLPGEQAHERILNEEGQEAADKFIDSQL